MNRAVIGIGSNIHPEFNIPFALQLLRSRFSVLAESSFETTKPVGADGQPDFVNGLVMLETVTDMGELKSGLLSIEFTAGRRRSENIFAPREIDLDILIWNNTVVDQNFYKIDFYRRALAQIWPTFNS